MIKYNMKINFHALGIVTLLTSGKAINKPSISVQMSVSKLCCHLCHHKLGCRHTMLSSTLKLLAVLLKNYFKAGFGDSEVSLLGLIFVRPNQQKLVRDG